MSPVQQGVVLFICRKICKHCRCGPEDHDLTDEDDRERQPAKQLLENHYDNVRDLSSRLHKLNIDDPAVQSEIVTPENDIIIHRIIAENLVSRKYGPVHEMPVSSIRHGRIQKCVCGGGGAGGPDPCWKITKIRVSQQYRSRTPKKTSQHSMLGHHRPASETPFKWRSAGGQMMARF